MSPTRSTQWGVQIVKSRSSFVAFALVFGFAWPTLAAEPTEPVRMGCGLMTFDTVPGWGLGADGKSVIGPTPRRRRRSTRTATSTPAPMPASSSSRPKARWSAASSATSIPTSTTWRSARKRTASSSTAARNANAEGIKFNAQTGEIVLKLPFPEESGLKLKQVQPHGDHRRPQRRHLPVRRLCQQPHLQVRQDRQVPDALRDQGERPQGIQHRPRHDARHALRPASPA